MEDYFVVTLDSGPNKLVDHPIENPDKLIDHPIEKNVYMNFLDKNFACTKDPSRKCQRAACTFLNSINCCAECVNASKCNVTCDLAGCGVTA